MRKVLFAASFSKKSVICRHLRREMSHLQLVQVRKGAFEAIMSEIGLFSSHLERESLVRSQFQPKVSLAANPSQKSHQQPCPSQKSHQQPCPCQMSHQQAVTVKSLISRQSHRPAVSELHMSPDSSQLRVDCEDCLVTGGVGEGEGRVTWRRLGGILGKWGW